MKLTCDYFSGNENGAPRSLRKKRFTYGRSCPRLHLPIYMSHRRILSNVFTSLVWIVVAACSNTGVGFGGATDFDAFYHSSTKSLLIRSGRFSLRRHHSGYFAGVQKPHSSSTDPLYTSILVGALSFETLVVILPAIVTFKPYSFNYIVNHNQRI